MVCSVFSFPSLLSLSVSLSHCLLCNSLFKHEHLAQLANAIVSSLLEMTHLFKTKRKCLGLSPGCTIKTCIYKTLHGFLVLKYLYEKQIGGSHNKIRKTPIHFRGVSTLMRDLIRDSSGTVARIHSLHGFALVWVELCVCLCVCVCVRVCVRVCVLTSFRHAQVCDWKSKQSFMCRENCRVKTVDECACPKLWFHICIVKAVFFYGLGDIGRLLS